MTFDELSVETPIPVHGLSLETIGKPEMSTSTSAMDCDMVKTTN